MPNEYEGHWISTRSVPKFYYLDPQPQDILIEDIAHALSMICRFGGHTSRFYSVAEHSIRVAGQLESYEANEDYQLAGLMHDAEEAYLPDIPRPIKADMPEAKEIYRRLNQAIMFKFRIPETIDWSIIKDFDNRLCLTEAKQFGLYNKDWDSLGREFRNLPEFGWSPEAAEIIFLYVYNDITQRRAG